jgi:hypothetical protein
MKWDNCTSIDSVNGFCVFRMLGGVRQAGLPPERMCRQQEAPKGTQQHKVLLLQQ